MTLLVVALCVLALVAWCGCVVLTDRSLAGGLASFVLGLALMVGAAHVGGAQVGADAAGQRP